MIDQCALGLRRVLRRLSTALPCFMLVLLTGCKLVITVPEGGAVFAESGSITCWSGEVCEIDIVDDSFDETYRVALAEGYHFVGWKEGERHFCARLQTPCRLFTTFFGLNPALMSLLGGDDAYYLAPHIVPVSEYDFSALNTRLENFVSETGINGVSVAVLDKHLGVVHEQAFGAFDLDTVVLLASASKLSSATLLMAIERDKKLGFDIDSPISQYLSWQGHYGEITTEQLLSNTSGIPGISFVDTYGPHLCQFVANKTLQECAQAIYEYRLPLLWPPGTVYSYGGSQWQLAGAVAEQVGGKPWGALFDKYVGLPCELEVFEYGNMLVPAVKDTWTGSPDSLMGQSNPNVEAGAISNLQDYGKLLQLHLNDGWCGSKRVLAAGATDFMRIDRKLPRVPGEMDFGNGYGLSWWIRSISETFQPDIFWIPGGNGTHAWIDGRHDYGVVLLVEDLSGDFKDQISSLVHGDLFALVREIMEARRSKIGTITEYFDQDPGWVAFNLPDDGNDFGYRDSSYAGGNTGEAGGFFSADDSFSWYGNNSIGKFTGNAKLAGEGSLTIQSVDAHYNNNVFIGHFDSESGSDIHGFGFQILEQRSTNPGLPPSSFRIWYRIGSMEGPLFTIDNSREPRTWAYIYDPDAGDHGSLTVSISGSGGDSATVYLSALERMLIQDMDTFGIAVAPQGQRPERLELYIDDVTYSVK